MGKKHKVRCKSKDDYIRKGSGDKMDSDINNLTNVVNQELNNETLVNPCLDPSNFRMGLGRRNRKMPSRFLDSVIEEPSLQGLPIAIESIKREREQEDALSKKHKYTRFKP